MRKLAFFIFLISFIFSCKTKQVSLDLGETDTYLNVDEEMLDLNSEAWPPADSLISWIGSSSFCYHDLPSNHKWENLGPFTSVNSRMQNQGRIQSITVHPKNKSNIIIGSVNGGVWKTMDGGLNWHNTTDDEGFSLIGVHDIVRHPNDPDILYAVTAVALGIWNKPSRNYGIGLIFSTDGGESWKISGLKKNFGGWQSHLNALVIDPRSTMDSTIIYAAGPRGVYVYRGSHIPSGEWEEIAKDLKYYSLKSHHGAANYHDIEITKRGIVYFANMFGVFEYDGKGEPKRLDHLPVPDAHYLGEKHSECAHDKPETAFYDIAINKLDEITIVANHSYYRKMGNICKMKSKPYYITQSFDLGKTWSPLVASRTSGYKIPNIAVSPYNSKILYTEGSNRMMYKSINGGITFRRMKQIRNHVDVRDLEMYSGKYGDTLGVFDELYVATDGGISVTKEDEQWHDITGQGICNTNFFGLDVFEEDTSYIVLGAQDGNQNFYSKGQWFTTQPGGDNGDCSIDPKDKLNVLQSANGSVYTTKFSGTRVRARSRHRAIKGYQLFPIVRNPSNSNQIFIGGNSISYSADNGIHWEVILKDRLPHPKKMVTSIAISKADSNTVYYTIDGYFYDKKYPANDKRNIGGIYKLTRENNDWSIIDISNNLKSKCKDDICGLPHILYSVAVSPTDKNHLIAGYNGFSRKRKIFESLDGGRIMDKHYKLFTQCTH